MSIMATLSSDKGLRDTKFRVFGEDFFEEFCEESFVDPVEVDVIDESVDGGAEIRLVRV